MNINEPDDIAVLMARLGEPHVRQRMKIQIERASEMFGTGTTLLHIENMEWLMAFIYWGLRVTGLFGIGYRNSHDFQVSHNPISAPDLPPEFDGFTILHLSDLHLDQDPEFVDALVPRLAGIEYDICLITGDFRASTSGRYDHAVAAVEKLMPHLRQPVYAVLGNHDFIEMVPPMEKLGCRFLLNENVAIERGGARIHIAGVDDPHFYQADNLHKAMEGIPADAFCVLLSHTPEIYRKASATGCDLVLSGHTHAGQICLPGGLPVLCNIRGPRCLISGNWTHRGLRGYTSRGTGSCGVPARFFCPPEIALHKLVQAP